jgi:Protein involved in formate dehydrogenase formation
MFASSVRFVGRPRAIAYQGIDGDADIVKVETCDRCRGHVKILYQHKEPALDPIAGDVATVALDLMVGEAAIAEAPSIRSCWAIDQKGVYDGRRASSASVRIVVEPIIARDRATDAS